MKKLTNRKRLLYSFLILFLFFLILEGGVRLFGLAPPRRERFIEFFNDPLDIRRTSKIFRFDEHTFWEPVEGEYKKLWMGAGFWVNSVGFRGKEEVPVVKPEGTFRIIGIGDSSTFGVGVSFQETFLKQLLDLYRARYPQRKFDIVNGGVPGYSSFQGRMRLEKKLAAYKPDLATIYFGYNDMMEATRFTDLEATQWSKSLGGKMTRLFDRSALYRTLSNLFFPRSPIGERRKKRLEEVKEIIREKGRFDEKYKVRVPPDDFKKNLAAMVDTLRAQGCRPFLLGYAFGKKFRWVYPYHSNYIAAVKAVAHEKKVEHLDLSEIFDQSGEKLLFGDGFHPNPQGHALIAKKIFALVTREE